MKQEVLDLIAALETATDAGKGIWFWQQFFRTRRYRQVREQFDEVLRQASALNRSNLSPEEELAITLPIIKAGLENFLLSM